MQVIKETEAQQQNSGFATDHDLRRHIKCSRSKVWQLVKDDPNFPKPVKVTNGMTRWLWSDVHKWENALKSK